MRNKLIDTGFHSFWAQVEKSIQKIEIKKNGMESFNEVKFQTHHIHLKRCCQFGNDENKYDVSSIIASAIINYI